MLHNATPAWEGTTPTDLGAAVDSHLAAHRPPSPYALANGDVRWLNAIRVRAAHDPKVRDYTEKMIALLANPQSAGSSFQKEFLALYEDSWRQAYPLARLLFEQHQKFAGIAQDYTLGFFDLGMVRAIEDEALADPTARAFVNEMLKGLRALAAKPLHAVLPGVFEVYSEALVYHLLKKRGGDRLTIEKIDDPSSSNPDFRCVLQTSDRDEPRELEFFIEIKALDIATSPQRLPELTDESLDANIELERQLREGKRLAMTTREIAPLRRAHSDAKYDPWSPRKLIEFLIEKASNNFKASQFKRGPTFALANLIRLPVLDQGANALAPFFYDDLNGGACISGVLWHLAFGDLGASVHRTPEFEGAGTSDGKLERAGILADVGNPLPAAGLIVFQNDADGYQFRSLYDTAWVEKSNGWSDLETHEVLTVLCDAFNDRQNTMAHVFSRRQP